MSYYQKKKQELRELTKDFQLQFNQENYSWWDVCEFTNWIYEQAKRFGLVRELKENGVI